MKNKLIGLDEAARMVQNGDMVAFGGNVLHRAPMAFARELVRQGTGSLRVVKTAGAHEVDLLCAAGCVQSVDAGFISYESKYGLATHYRKAVESGAVRANEHACYTVISALRASACGAPFMPVRGLTVSDLLKYNSYFTVIDDPFGTGPITLVKALRPDVAVIHVQKCDRSGNAIIEGPRFDDVLMAKAAKKVIITTETLLPDNSFLVSPQSVTIPQLLVTAVVVAPRGAQPCSCYGRYEVDDGALTAFKQLKTQEEILRFTARYQASDNKK